MTAKVRVGSLASTTRLILGFPKHVPTGTQVMVCRSSKGSYQRYLVEWAGVGVYWVDADALIGADNSAR